MPASPQDVTHLLNRAAFGATAEQVGEFTKLDLSQVVDRLLNAEAPAVALPNGPIAQKGDDYPRKVEAMQYWLERMATAPAPVVEKMALFWHGHFTSSQAATSMMHMWEQIELFRSDGMGDFLELAQKVSVGTAMLQWLTNSQNMVGSPNENFARELMELFTLGVNEYTQEDIVASARAWTGHNLTNGEEDYKFYADRHDNDNKTFFGITKNWDGPQVLTEICTGQKSTIFARFVTTKLWEFFAYTKPSDALVADLAAGFLANKRNIKELLRSIFNRPEFYSEQARTSHVRSPAEFAAASLKFTGAKVTDLHPEWYMESMGQALFEPPNVAGWKGGTAWIAVSSMYARANFARRLIDQAMDSGAFASLADQPVEGAVTATFAAFGVPQPTAASVASISKALTRERAASANDKGTANLLMLVLLSPEFQRVEGYARHGV